MDPNEILKHIRQLTSAVGATIALAPPTNVVEGTLVALSERFDELDNLLKGGAELPEEWRTK